MERPDRWRYGPLMRRLSLWGRGRVSPRRVAQDGATEVSLITERPPQRISPRDSRPAVQESALLRTDLNARLHAAVAPAVNRYASQGTAHGRFARAIRERHVLAAEMAAREMGQLSLVDALALVACYARTGSPKFEQAAVRWLERLAAEREASLRDVRLAAAALEALQTRQHDLAEKMLLRFLS
jgi:hypothetical protein